MKRLLITLAVALTVVVTASCGNSSSIKLTGKDSTNTYTFNNARGLSVSSAIDVELVPNNELVTTIIEVTADEALLPRVVVNEHSGILSLSIQGNVNLKKTEIRARITGPALSQYSLSAGADLKCYQQLQGKDFNFTTSSSGDFDLTDVVATDKISVTTSSSGDFECKVVQAPMVNLSASSSGDIEISKVIATSLNANSSSGADIEIKITKAANIAVNSSSGADIDLKSIEATAIAASASSGADISLSGTTGSFAKKVSSGGKIDVRSLKVIQ
ncbi:MAG: DUF2807 domain-containing protein [Bacteroidales bacterium]|nr:DUF2807 domain-containing protein [Bacteroidales bacterium]